MASNTRGRGRSGRGTFMDRGRNHNSTLSSVPNIQQVIIGSSVSMVLKVDQPTGREVQGVVAELLTRGNHPRGIKVRLQDGRVGRVQRMVSKELAGDIAVESSGLGSIGEASSGISGGDQPTSTTRETFLPPKYGDFRIDAPDEPPSANLSLADYVVTKGKGKGKRSKNGATKYQDTDISHQDEASNDRPDINSTTSTCPVCGEFEGDEIAVAHHVNEHFG